MKSPHHSLLKPTVETFSFVLKLSNSQIQILYQLGLFFYPHKLPFSYNEVPPHSTCPCFRLHCKKGTAARITAHLLIPNFWAKKSNILTQVLGIFVGWKITSHFHQCYQNTQTQGRRALAGKTLLAECPPHSRCLPSIPASAAKFTHWNPPTCFLPALNSRGIRAPATCVHGCVTVKLWGRHSFPSFWLPPRTHFQQHTTHLPPWLTCKHSWRGPGCPPTVQFPCVP